MAAGLEAAEEGGRAALIASYVLLLEVFSLLREEIDSSFPNRLVRKGGRHRKEQASEKSVSHREVSHPPLSKGKIEEEVGSNLLSLLSSESPPPPAR